MGLEELMCRIPKCCWFIVPVAFLMAADPAWKAKPIADWTEADAQQILANSPWAKTVVAGITRRETEDERREGGNMGQPMGVGYDGVDDKKAPLTVGGILSGKPQPLPSPIRLTVRWENALPIRMAELKTHEGQPPTLSDDGYIIAVYGIPISYAKGDPKSLGDPLKGLAALKRKGKKDVRPSSVEVFQLEHSLVAVYLFPLSAEISKRDSLVEFTALIGRLQVSPIFNIAEMQFQGKLEL
jgi:hypothetical protein